MAAAPPRLPSQHRWCAHRVAASGAELVRTRRNVNHGGRASTRFSVRWHSVQRSVTVTVTRTCWRPFAAAVGIPARLTIIILVHASVRCIPHLCICCCTAKHIKLHDALLLLDLLRVVGRQVYHACAFTSAATHLQGTSKIPHPSSLPLEGELPRTPTITWCIRAAIQY